jgi:hypothetical protein
MKTQNIILDSINYLKNFVPTNKEFNTYKHIGRAVSNPLNVSFISEGKIKGIKENTGVTIGNRPTAEQRKKYFTQTSINKLLKKLFVINTNNESKKIENVSNEIDDFLKSSINYDFFINDNVSQFYADEPKEYNGSCMAGKPKEFFKIYDLINQYKLYNVKIVGLKSGDNILARGLLWSRTFQKDILCEDTGKILETKTQTKYFLDRIYIHNKMQNVSFNELQFKLFNKVRQAFKIDFLDAFNKSHLESYILNKYANKNTEKFKFKFKYSYPSFVIPLDYDEVLELERFPYLDTFRFMDSNGYLSQNSDEAAIIFSQTDGYFEEGGKTCECCGAHIDEGEEFHTIDDEILCGDCAIYIEEREEYAHPDNAIYNNYSGVYHYESDLDR